MARLTVLPEGIAREIEAGTTLPAALWQMRIAAQTPCGGFGMCGRCAVRFVAGAPAPEASDLAQLGRERVAEGWRLACGVVLQTDATVEIPESSREQLVNILTTGRERAVGLAPGPLPWVPGLRPALGMAFDIGTTTIAGYLVNLATGRQVSASACLNPQVREGADVVSRLALVMREGEGATRRLQRLVVEAMNGLLRDCLADGAGREVQVCRVVAVGNPAMLHLLLGRPTDSLALAPYAPMFRESQCVGAAELGLETHAEAMLHTLPLVAGFVGADTVSMALAEFATEPDGETTLALDIGTNGEVVLRHEGRLWCASAAAGPAFEGGNIEFGMRAEPGAIAAVDLERGADGLPWLRVTTLGSGLARGLCGSGLIDAVAELLKAGLIDETGRLVSEAGAPWALRIMQLPEYDDRAAQRAFLLVDGGASARRGGVLLTQRDVREVQLAKGSIRATAETLLRAAGIGWESVGQVLLAGAFGSYVRVESAIRIGLLPELPMDRFVSIGNSAGAGARIALRSEAELARSESLARRMQHLCMAGNPEYEEAFLQHLGFPFAG